MSCQFGGCPNPVQGQDKWGRLLCAVHLANPTGIPTPSEPKVEKAVDKPKANKAKQPAANKKKTPAANKGG